MGMEWGGVGHMCDRQSPIPTPARCQIRSPSDPPTCCIVPAPPATAVEAPLRAFVSTMAGPVHTLCFVLWVGVSGDGMLRWLEKGSGVVVGYQMRWMMIGVDESINQWMAAMDRSSPIDRQINKSMVAPLLLRTLASWQASKQASNGMKAPRPPSSISSATHATLRFAPPSPKVDASLLLCFEVCTSIQCVCV